MNGTSLVIDLRTTVAGIMQIRNVRQNTVQVFLSVVEDISFKDFQPSCRHSFITCNEVPGSIIIINLVQGFLGNLSKN